MFYKTHNSFVCSSKIIIQIIVQLKVIVPVNEDYFLNIIKFLICLHSCLCTLLSRAAINQTSSMFHKEVPDEISLKSLKLEVHRMAVNRFSAWF